MTNQVVSDKTQATRVTPAGWYQDPASGDKVRWWNGLSWTDHTAEKPDVSDEQRIADARKLEREFGISTAENAVMTGAAAVVPATAAPVASAPAAVASSRSAQTGTGGVWLLAFIPLFALIIAAAAGYVYFYVSPTPLVVIAAVVLWMLGLLWAISDSRALESRGIDSPKPLWALVGAIVYLVLRRAKIPTWGPIAVFAIITVVAGGGLLAATLSGAVAPVSTALNVQLTLHHDLVDSGQLTSVSCPPVIESSNAGELFTCTGTAPDGTSRNVWVSFDDTSGSFSYAIDIRAN